MSELIAHQNKQGRIGVYLLSTTSVIALAACVASTEALAADHPTVWLEAGYHFDSVTGSSGSYVPPLDALTKAGGFPALTDVENVLGRASGAEGKISFEPRGSDWVFAISARYGRTHSTRNVHQQKQIFGPPMKKTIQSPSLYNKIPYTPVFTGYADQSVDNSEAHTIVDFQIGRDVGVGLLGHATDSVISFGARYAQLNIRSQIEAHDAPDAIFIQSTGPGLVIHPKYYIQTHNHASISLAHRYNNFHAFGPSISMSNTTALNGNPTDGQIALDWGMNAAVLFGRQRTKVTHQSTVQYLDGFKGIKTIAAVPVATARSRTVTVPNLGGFAALSYRFTRAKLSLGYHADFFFGAMDRGIDARRSVTTGYHGPYATISIGLGG
jgi:hypothetical protein